MAWTAVQLKHQVCNLRDQPFVVLQVLVKNLDPETPHQSAHDGY